MSERSLVDWELAAKTGVRLASAGPPVSRAEAELIVGELREFTEQADLHVRQLTGLGHGLPLLPGDVVDRAGWIRAAAAGLETLTGQALRHERGPKLGSLVAKGAGVQTGAVLAFLAAKILGQYDPFGGADHSGSLLLVAPNITSAQRAMKVDGRDFRMWVCLHEGTHRLQFTSVPWLRDYFAAEVTRLITSVTGEESESVVDLVKRIPQVLSSQNNDEQKRPSLGELLRSGRQRETFDRLIALSTLLEGHADYVMDAVGPQVVSTVETIRERFTQRRKGSGPIDRLLRSLLGLDAKIRQYAEGAEFTRQVISQVGMTGFNAVWSSPETLPTKGELADPPSWVHRVRP